MRAAPAGLCDAGSSQLLVIDIQERLSAAMPDDGLRRTIRNTGNLVDVATRLSIPVAVTEQYPRGLGRTVGAIRERLPSDCFQADKTCFSCCGASGFGAALQPLTRPQVVVTGMETHVCVLQTAIELVQQGFQVYVVEDAVCARFESDHRNALARMATAGITVSCTESVIFEWLRDASHPAFKAVTAALKSRSD